MKLTFTDEERFESFAYLYLLGQQAQRKGHRLVLKTPATVIGEDAMVNALRELEAMPPYASGNGAPDPKPESEAPADDDGVVHEHIDLPPAGEPEQEAEKPKRKRRTKAEIEAAAMAEQRTFDPAQEPDAGEFPSSDGIVTNSDASDTGEMVVTDAHAIEVIEAGPTGIGYNAPEADKPVGASAESLEKHAAAQAEYTPELIETLKGQAELFDANRTAHLNEGREAIAKHGFIKYMATFKGLGLDSAIATYNDDQVKLHRAAIAHLMAA